MLDLAEQLVRVRVVEDRPQSQELVEGGAQGVDVVAAVGLALEPLGRHVAQGPGEGLGGRLVLLLLELRQAEVGDPGVAQGVEQDVVRLDVAVDHPALVGVIERVGHLGADAGDLALIAERRLAAPGRTGEAAEAR